MEEFGLMLQCFINSGAVYVDKRCKEKKIRYYTPCYFIRPSPRKLK